MANKKLNAMKKGLANSIANIFNGAFDGAKFENVSNWCGKQLPNVFVYGAMSEMCMEKRLQENGKERKTTFMSDLSIAEWAGGVHGVLDTINRCMVSWVDNEEYIAEFVLCVNWKAWEHYERGNTTWAKFYSIMYDIVRDLVYDYHEGDEEKVAYIYEYLD